MIGKKYINEHNLGQKVRNALNVGAKVAVGAVIGAGAATAYHKHQQNKENEHLHHELQTTRNMLGNQIKAYNDLHGRIYEQQRNNVHEAIRNGKNMSAANGQIVYH